MIKKKQSGFTMIELMVAMVIGIFLLGALSILAFDNKRAFTGQNYMAQLQDNERMAATIMTDVIQTAGYYPSPQANTAVTSIPAGSVPAAMVAGQSLSGATGDSITVRYATNYRDGVILCSGNDNETGATNYFGATFSVNASNQLVCNMTTGNGAAVPYPLVNNVSSLAILYGVNSGSNGNNVDSYMTAAQVTANTDWPNVMSVQITITFINPLAAATNKQVGQGTEAATIAFTRTVALMNKAGI
jgi:type IV pilus assembly protein PilW